jgi:uncharacterized protein (TIGR01777 family)
MSPPNTTLFESSVELPVSVDRSFAYHESLGALQRLVPVWENAKVIESDRSLKPGSKVTLQVKKFGLPLTWKAVHRAYDPPHLFSDYQASGPFAVWEHEHRFTAVSDTTSRLTDHIQYRIPAGGLGTRLMGSTIRKDIASMFRYRHAVTQNDLQLSKRVGCDHPLRIAISGSTGMVGNRLVSLLTILGHDVCRMVRTGSQTETDLKENDPLEAATIDWDPRSGLADPEQVSGFDAVIHLAGANIAGGRWTVQRKQILRDSRVGPTQKLAEQLAALSNPPKAFVTASGAGIYGDRGDEWLGEESAIGVGFLAELARDWEAATEPAKTAGIRVCQSRFPPILHPREGALGKTIPLFKMMLGGRLGSGNQYFSWIEFDDAVSVLLWLATQPQCVGAFNVATPNPPTNKEFTRVLSGVLKRPARLPAPAWGLRLALGEMADSLLLASNRLDVSKLQESGYEFRFPELDGALRHLCGTESA